MQEKSKGLPDPKIQQDTKKVLDKLSVKELKYLAKNKGIKLKGTISEGLIYNTVHAPSKVQYVRVLSKEITNQEIDQVLRTIPKPEPKKKRRTRK